MKHLKDLFGDEDAEDRERYISELKAQYGDKWKFTSDPFLLHIRLKKLAPIPYTEWPHKSHRFQVYPYMADDMGLEIVKLAMKVLDGHGCTSKILYFQPKI